MEELKVRQYEVEPSFDIFMKEIKEKNKISTNDVDILFIEKSFNEIGRTIFVEDEKFNIDFDYIPLYGFLIKDRICKKGIFTSLNIAFEKNKDNSINFEKFEWLLCNHKFKNVKTLARELVKFWFYCWEHSHKCK